MALTVEQTKYIGRRGYVGIFAFHVSLHLLLFGLALVAILAFGDTLSPEAFRRTYRQLIPLTVGVPVVLSITTTLSYMVAQLSIVPSEAVDMERLRGYFFQRGYTLCTSPSGERIVFKRSNALRRLLCLNHDQPHIELTSSGVRVVLLRRLAGDLAHQLRHDSRFELQPDSGS